ncbi:MAG TPA: hypothetical protein VF772_19900, partial [Terriglobales bacterium]
LLTTTTPVDSSVPWANNSLGRVGMKSRISLLVVLFCLLAEAGALAQFEDLLSSPAANPPADTEHVGPGPEDALLSPTCYVNTYFGFKLDFPSDAKLKAIAVPATADRRIQLLEMVGASPEYAAISISVYEYKNKNYTDAKGILRRQLDQELFIGVEELHGLAKISIANHPFYYFETRRGGEQHMDLAADLPGYVLLVMLKANDPRMVKELASEFYHLDFFPPPEASRHATTDAKPYDGPAISAQRLREVKRSAPAEHMDPGKIEGNIYRNAQIGVKYEFPQGWSIQPHGAIEPAVIHYREKVTGEPTLGPRERAVVQACRRTLLSAWRTKPDADGQVPYDEFGEVTLSAMPLSCFPNIHFPDDPKDAAAIRRFVVELSLTEPLQRDMTDARTYEAGGQSFVLTHGTIAYKEDGDALSHRISVAMALTQHRGYLLLFLFAAPHDAELRELMASKVGFDAEPPSKEAVADKNGGGTPENPVPPASPAPNAMPPLSQPASPADGTTAPAAPTQSSPPVPAAAPAADPGSQAYARPSLLREGEDIESQQMQGKPLPDKKPN